MIKTKVIGIIKKICKKKIKFSNSKDLISSQVLDSLSIMILISEIEKNFTIRIKMKNFNLNNFRSINNIVKFIKKNEKNS